MIIHRIRIHNTSSNDLIIIHGYSLTASLSRDRSRIHMIWIRIRIQIQNYRLNTDPDLDPIRIQGLDDQKCKRITAEKNFYKICLDQKLKFLSLGLHKGRPSYRQKSLQLFFFSVYFTATCKWMLNHMSL